MKKRICFYQAFGGSFFQNFQNGCGDCSICIQDEKNMNCVNYFSITLSIVEVGDKQEIACAL